MRIAVPVLASFVLFGCSDKAPPGAHVDPGFGPSTEREIHTPAPWTTAPPATPGEPALAPPDAQPDPGASATGGDDPAPAEADPAPGGAPEPSPDPVHEPADCPPQIGDARLAVQVRYAGGDALQPGDGVLVSLQLTASPHPDAAWIRIAHANVRPDPASFRLDDAPVDDLIAGGQVVRVPLAAVAGASLSYTAEFIGDPGPVTVLAVLERQQGACAEPGAGSGAILQPLAADRTKGEACIDVTEMASLQLSALLNERGTDAYRAANGEREDLWADDFIYCPGPPAVAYATEVCLIADPDPATQTVLAGTADLDAGGAWSVDDFALFEVLDPDTGEVLADAVTTQSHPGADTFWCPEAERLMCRGGCTASLRRDPGARDIPALAVTDATGGGARTLPDGAVALTDLLPADGERVNLRVSILDVGMVGAVTPDLYLVFTR